MPLTEKDVIFTIECLPEYASAYKELEAADYAWVKRQEKLGNEWAWCVVKVTATVQHPNGYDVLTGVDYLSGCMYESQNDFIKNSGYWQDMKNTALADVNAVGGSCFGGAKGLIMKIRIHDDAASGTARTSTLPIAGTACPKVNASGTRDLNPLRAKCWMLTPSSSTTSSTQLMPHVSSLSAMLLRSLMTNARTVRSGEHCNEYYVLADEKCLMTTADTAMRAGRTNLW